MAAAEGSRPSRSSRRVELSHAAVFLAVEDSALVDLARDGLSIAYDVEPIACNAFDVEPDGGSLASEGFALWQQGR